MGAIMGILNITPDSFSDGGLYNTPETALAHAAQLIKEGADIIDVGGESTRPGAEPVEPEEEQNRIIPIIRALRKKHRKLRISVDTRHASTARLALKAGADIINDVTGLTDPAMIKVCAKHPCGIIIMHLRNDPERLHTHPTYLDIVKEVHHFFTQRIEAAEAGGIERCRLCLDPGIGFGKNTADNLALIHRMEELRVDEMPLLMGLSRKRFLGELIGDATAAKTTYLPTVGMSLVAADSGADIHRVHDVAAHRTALKLRYQDLHYPLQRF